MCSSMHGVIVVDVIFTFQKQWKDGHFFLKLSLIMLGILKQCTKLDVLKYR